MFDNKTLLITGGTGSFGNLVLKRSLSTKIKEIRIFSRDEKKQDDLRKKFNNSRLKFFIGDVRDYSSVLNATRGANYIFHAAALKQVDTANEGPSTAIPELGRRGRADPLFAVSLPRCVGQYATKYRAPEYCPGYVSLARFWDFQIRLKRRREWASPEVSFAPP